MKSVTSKDKIDSWLETFESEGTQKEYGLALKEFFREIANNGSVENSEQLEKHLREYISYLKNKPIYDQSRTEIVRYGCAPKTINMRVASVVSFFKDHGIAIDEKTWRQMRRRKVIPKASKRTVDSAGKPEEWKRLLSHMDIRGRSLFLFLLSSGCRIGETLELTEADIVPYLDLEPPRAFVRSEYTKGEESGRWVFMSQEARDAIKEWLRLKELTKKRGKCNLEGLENINYSNYWSKVYMWDISEGTARLILYNALEKTGLGLRDIQTDRRKIHVHSTRKFFKNNCGLDADLKKALMGHQSELDEAYYTELRENPDKVGQEYVSVAMQNLTIFERPTMSKLEQLKAGKRFGHDRGRNRKYIAG